MTLVVEYYSTTLSSLTVVTVEFEFRPVVPSSNSNLSVVSYFEFGSYNVSHFSSADVVSLRYAHSLQPFYSLNLLKC